VFQLGKYLESKGTALITQGDKMFKVFSRPQIDLEDILKFDKVKTYVSENDLDQKFGASRDSGKIFWIH
jgi:tRNA uridine 5-carboxymethylaminomethyl modification enzyme